MCGGSGPKAPKPVDPMEQAAAQIEQMKQQYALDQQAADAAAQRKAAEEAAGRKQWQTDLGSSRASAEKGIDTLFTSKGLNPKSYAENIANALDLEQGSKTYGGDTGFSSTLGTGLLDDIRSQKVRAYEGAVDKFAPTGSADTMFGSTKDDAILASILGDQYSTASDSLTRARDRGTLDTAGYTAALGKLDTQKSAANARLQDLGGGVLSGYRDDLTGIADRARTAAGNWDFGSTFDPHAYAKQYRSTGADLSGRLEGDIRNAVGGEQFFNIDDLIQQGGVAQGAVNTGLGGSSNALLSAIASRKKDEVAKRGLGTQGAF